MWAEFSVLPYFTRKSIQPSIHRIMYREWVYSAGGQNKCCLLQHIASRTGLWNTDLEDWWIYLRRRRHVHPEVHPTVRTWICKLTCLLQLTWTERTSVSRRTIYILSTHGTPASSHMNCCKSVGLGLELGILGNQGGMLQSDLNFFRPVLVSRFQENAGFCRTRENAKGWFDRSIDGELLANIAVARIRCQRLLDSQLVLWYLDFVISSQLLWWTYECHV